MSINNHDDNLKNKMAKRIREVRKCLDLNQGQLADHLPCSRSNLSQVENGVFFPGVSILDALINKFNVSLDWLFTGKGPMFIDEKEKGLDLLDFGKDTEEIKEMLEEMKESPALKHRVLSDYYSLVGVERFRQQKEEIKKKIKEQMTNDQ
ncbi:MAG: helix-turn-helix domain-containing protein [Candidatus Aminicenantes bacterium]|nr:helix-turn-helix domain-containing protein [Candidatus Aminicenantes bacterium]NIM84679.1 helix-turn-helix domain-containing protein [Candidatus Aminicenantes bacterium]NIN24178.1 helix-turn-helix domain-containing protein [Candidatus Aminicenantes bacterium]NIN47903.1 helix-turn-helix domain-containing protein [Candidatus Aminicenantes bacterium]NIN90841.1 helix-turn-helix domain-containing protein [Candidatus Aminicenantes bacterium]